MRGLDMLLALGRFRRFAHAHSLVGMCVRDEGDRVKPNLQPGRLSLLVLLVAFGAGYSAACHSGHALPDGPARMKRFPHLMLWAWEQPEDLTFINPGTTGAAFLAATIYLQGSSVEVQPRTQPFAAPPGAPLMATVRIEASQFPPPELTSDQRRQTVEAVVRLSRMQEVAGVQIDFDATSSEHAFYREILESLRRGMPPSTALSITALASWCNSGSWLSGLPVDDVVPMLFRMGRDRDTIFRALARGEDFSQPACRQSIGISTDEPAPPLPRGRRMYIFSPTPWTQASLARALRGK